MGCGRDRPALPAARAAAPTPRAAPPPVPAGRPVPAGDADALAALDRFLAAPILERPCGPYTLRSDLAGARLERAVALCSRVASALEGEIGARFGVAPAHPPRGTIVLFASRRRYREAGAAASDLPLGYAGWSEARLGVVATTADGVGDDELARTLAHELTHFAERRLFGFPRPRWLAEGLADALSDSASAAGFTPLESIAGAEVARRRWLERPASQPGAASADGALARLVALDWDQFDADPSRRDYELASLFVRFLLLDAELAPRFRAWLAGQTVVVRSPRGLPEALATDWPTLNRRFEAWVAAPRPR